MRFFNYLGAAHIKDVANLLGNSLFIYQDNCSDEESKQFDIAIYKWVEKGKKEFGWNDQLIAGLMADGHRMKDTKGNLEIPIQNFSLKQTRAEVDCDCNYDDVIFTLCTYPSICDNTIPCRKLDKGCGLLWRDPCDGFCLP